MTRLVVFFAMLALSAGCDVPTITWHVGNHSFAVPRSHLLDQSIWFVPRTEEDGLLFVLNPESELPDHINVALGVASQMCQGGVALGSGSSEPSCKKSVVSASTHPFLVAKLHKEMGDVGNVAWSYRTHSQDGEYVVAACTMSYTTGAYPGVSRGGLCSALGSYRDLLFQISFRESQLSQLPILVGEAQKDLSSWEAAAKTNDAR